MTIPNITPELIVE